MNLSRDESIRREALRTEESFIVEAPAGSGKTALLTARYLALLGKVSHPGQILAVTFTRKAAAEMSTRITSVLSQASSGEDSSLENEWESLLLSLGRKALERHRSHPARLFNPESLQVGTFHGFCASLVRDWPLEAEIPPGLGLLDEMDQADLLERAVTEYVEDLIARKAASAEVEAYRRCLASTNNDAKLLSRQLQELLARRDRLKPFLEIFGRRDGKSLSKELEKRLEEYSSLYLSSLHHCFEREVEKWKALKKALGRSKLGETFPEKVPGTGLAGITEWKEIANVFLTREGTPRKQLGPKNGFPEGFGKTPSGEWIKGLPKRVADQLHFVRGWPEAREDNIGLLELSDLLIVVGGILKRFQELLRTRGLDYLELEMAALRALSKPEHPSEGLIFYHEHLKHILVDEAQDLNDLQVEILSKLTEGWEPGDGRTVFMVGDPKQSIYRFRRAEVSLFYELKERGLRREGESPFPLKTLTLSANFRSRPHLVRFANDLFEKVMADPQPIYDEVAFSPSLPSREKSVAPIPVTVAVFRGEEGAPLETEALREQEAQWVSASVAKLRDDHPNDTLGILIPVRTHLPTFLRALRELHLPVCLLEGEPLSERPEVLHLLNLFRALVRPYDDVAWAGAIRAPWCHVPDQVLLELASEEGPWSKRILQEQDRWPEVSRFRHSVNETLKMFGREPYARTLGRLWEDLDGPRVTAMRYGLSGVSNVRAFLDLLGSCSGLLAEEALLKVTDLLESAYTPPDPGGAFSNIQMMTIHKAKGLEFDHVFCVNMGYDPLRGGRGEEPAYRMARLPGEEKPLLMAASKDRRTGERSLASHLLKELDQRRDLAEVRRLFYVAVTRARESLTITGTGKMVKEGEGSKFANPLSALLKILSQENSLRSSIRYLENPGPPQGRPVRSVISLSQVSPPSFEAEPLPYRIESPSRIEDETLLAAPAGSEEEEGGRRARGIVLHRLLETLSKGGSLPDSEAVAMALSAEGLPLTEARQRAPDVLKEARTAWDLDAFRTLLEKARLVETEWAAEDFDGEGRLRVGRFDLLIRQEQGWVVVDYKTTSPPEGEVEGWIKTQTMRYRFQLRSYVQMLARVLGTPEEAVKGAILFTAIPRLVYL